jgi:ascorbate-specific PTS system EIIC-type component UlaA
MGKAAIGTFMISIGAGIMYTSRRELVAALSDAAELEADANVHEVLAGWRATARIKADKSEYARALQETSGNFGSVEVSA